MRAWLQAARLPSAVNLQLPLLFGQTLAYATYGAVSAPLCLLLPLYGLAMQLFIVFLNDWADRQVDALNETPTLFSGGSRVLVERRIEPATLLRAGLFSGIAVLALGLLLAAAHNRPLAPFLFVGGLFLLWSYSLPPLRLNYRGGGELLQALGRRMYFTRSRLLRTGGASSRTPPRRKPPVYHCANSRIHLLANHRSNCLYPTRCRGRSTHGQTPSRPLGRAKSGRNRHRTRPANASLPLYERRPPCGLIRAGIALGRRALFLLPSSHQSARATLWLTGLLIAPAVSFALAALYALIYIPL